MNATTAAARTPLLRRVMTAGAWIVGGNVIAQLMRLTTNIILTRLLFPDAFGLMAVVNILLTALGLFSDIGVIRSVINSPRGEDPDLLDTAWTLQIIRGFGLAVGCLVCGLMLLAVQHSAWLTGRTVYADPRLPPMLMVFALVPAISGFESIRIGLARRAMRLHLLVKIDLVSQIVSALTMVAVGVGTRSHWTLVVGAFAAGLTKCLLGHGFLPGPREHMRIERSAMTEILSTAKWIFMSSAFTFLSVNADRLLLGGLTDSRTLGLYAIALLSINVVQGVANSLSGSVVYPALSEVARERPAMLERTSRHFQWVFDLSFVTASAILVTSAPALIDVIYDKRYHDAGWMLGALAVGALGWRYQFVEQCYQVAGRTEYMMYANLLRLLALMGGIVIGHALFGVDGIIYAVALSQYAAWPIALHFKRRLGLLNWRSEAFGLPSLLVGLVAGRLLAKLLELAFPGRFH